MPRRILERIRELIQADPSPDCSEVYDRATIRALEEFMDDVWKEKYRS